MKFYKKSDLSLKNGLLVSESGDVVNVDRNIVFEANTLETLLQKTAYLESQPKATPVPSLDGFKRKSIDDIRITKFEASTPTIDREIAKAMTMMDELDDVTVADKANQMLDEFKHLIEFVQDDSVLCCDPLGIHKFDTPTLGNVLELTEDDIITAVTTVCGLEEKKDDDDGFTAVRMTGEDIKNLFEDILDKGIED